MTYRMYAPVKLSNISIHSAGGVSFFLYDTVY